MKINTVFWLFSIFILPGGISAQPITNGDPTIKIDFEQTGDLSFFEFTDPGAWKRSEFDGSGVLELYGASDYQPKVRSPFNIALIREVKAGSFILEADLRQTGREYGHRDMVIVFGWQDASHFYYVHLASKADENAHNIFIVNNAPRKSIGLKTTAGIDWGKGWNKIRIERNSDTGSILVFFNDLSTPIIEGKDTNFNNGFIGFGSFDDTGMIDDIRIWSDDIQIVNSVFPNFKSE